MEQQIRAPRAHGPLSRRLPLALATALAILGGGASAVAAQTVRGSVLDRETAAPVRGALVVLLDEAGAQRAGSLSDERGGFTIAAPAAGRYSVRAQRVGYADGRTAVMEVGLGESVAVRIQLQSQAIELEGIAVQARRRCTVRPQEGLLVSRLWEEARKALGANAFADEQELYGYRIRSYRRTLDARSLAVLQDSFRIREILGRNQPYRALPADSLLRHGFIQADADGPVYFAPDAHVLLSDEFLDQYCLRPTTSAADPSLVGIHFQPVEARGPVAIAGTLWLDSDSYELRTLEYAYARVGDTEQSDRRIGGRIEYEALPAGAWIVRSWRIRMPAGVMQNVASGGLLPAGNRRMLTSIAEEGAEVLEIRASSGRRSLRNLATVEGMVFDSARAAPLSGAMVYLSGTSYADTTDAQGRFRIPEVADGEYQLSFTHPELRRLNIHPAPVEVRVEGGSPIVMQLGLPATARALAFAEACGETRGGRSQGRGILLGRVEDELTGEPIPMARVTLGWYGLEMRENLTSVDMPTLATQAGADGGFLLCGVPTDRRLQLHASQGPRVGSRISLDPLGEVAFVEQHLSIGLTRGESVALVLLDWETGRPIRDAIVSIPARGLQTLTDREGRARLENVPAGAHRFEIRHVAYGSIPDEIRIEPGTGELEIRVPGRAVEIAGVEVVVRSAVEMARRRTGASFAAMTRDQIEPLQGTARHVGDLARRLPGLRVREIYYRNSSMIRDLCLESTRTGGTVSSHLTQPECPSRILVVVDGVPSPPEYLSTLPLEHIESIQFLNSAEGAVRYGSNAGNGVLLIHTIGQGPFVTPRR